MSKKGNKTPAQVLDEVGASELIDLKSQSLLTLLDDLFKNKKARIIRTKSKNKVLIINDKISFWFVEDGSYDGWEAGDYRGSFKEDYQLKEKDEDMPTM